MEHSVLKLNADLDKTVEGYLFIMLSLHSTLDIGPMKVTDVFSRSKALYLSTDQFRLCAVHQAVQLLKKFCVLHSELPSHTEIFKPVLHFCDQLPVESYPEMLKVSYS